MGGLGLSAAFARVIRRHRERKGFSQEALAEEAGVHRTYIGLLERSERTPTIEVAGRIASALDRPLSRLIAEAERERP